MIYCELLSSNLHSAHTLQRSTTAPHPVTSNTTSKKPTCSNMWSFLLMMGIRCPKHVETVVNNQHLELTINHLYCCILFVFFLHNFTEYLAYAYISENELFPTMAVWQGKHVDAVQCHIFLNMLFSTIICDILQIPSGRKTLHFTNSNPPPPGLWVIGYQH